MDYLISQYEANRDEANRDEANRDEANRDEANRDEARQFLYDAMSGECRAATTMRKGSYS